MQYMLMRKADEETEKGILPSEAVFQAMADYNERMLKAGVMVTGNGLRPSSEGCRIHLREGEALVTDGPFTETKELLAGYTVLEVDSLEEAIAWAKQWPKEDGDVTLELRRYFAMEDFQPSPALEQHRRHQQLPSRMDIHLTFAGNCREAMQWYAELTGGQLEALVTLAETPGADCMPAERQDKIVHAALNIRGRYVMGADMADDCYQKPAGTSIHLEYDDPEAAERIFKQLASDGGVAMPFAETFWAYRFGMVTDKFGTGWMISCGLKECQ